MKRKRSMLMAIVVRFIAYSIGTALVIAMLEEILAALIPAMQGIFLYDSRPDLAHAMKPGEIVLAIAWGAAQLLVYGGGVWLFARGINRLLSAQVKERDEERMQLFSHIAHDLKTPMTTITGYAGALASGRVDDAAKQREYHLAIKAKSDQMNALTEQLLSYSKLGSQYRLKRSRTDLAELLRAACASVFGEIESMQMELTLDLPENPVYSMVDSLETSRAVGNLLMNAIRHNQRGAMLYAGLNQEREHIVIKIADSGSVIPESIANNLFEPFVSGSDSRNNGGNGLGLAIVKKVAEQHGGDVSLRDAPAPYTKMFVMRLPK